MRRASSLIYVLVILTMLVSVGETWALPPPCANLSIPCNSGTLYMLLNCTAGGQVLLTRGCYEITEGGVSVCVYVPPGCNMSITCSPTGFGEGGAGEMWNNTIKVNIPLENGGVSYFTPGESLPPNCVALRGNVSSRAAPGPENTEFCLLCITDSKLIASHAKTCAPGVDEVKVEWGSPLSLLGFPLIPVLEAKVVVPKGCEIVGLEGNIGPTVLRNGEREVRLGPLEIASLILGGRLTLSYEVRGVVLRESGGCFISRSVDEGVITLSPYLLWFVVVAGVLVFMSIGVIRLLRVEEVDVA